MPKTCPREGHPSKVPRTCNPSAHEPAKTTRTPWSTSAAPNTRKDNEWKPQDIIHICTSHMHMAVSEKSLLETVAITTEANKLVFEPDCMPEGPIGPWGPMGRRGPMSKWDPMGRWAPMGPRAHRASGAHGSTGSHGTPCAHRAPWALGPHGPIGHSVGLAKPIFSPP